jgi:hypothetical protein
MSYYVVRTGRHKARIKVARERTTARHPEQLVLKIGLEIGSGGLVYDTYPVGDSGLIVGRQNGLFQALEIEAFNEPSDLVGHEVLVELELRDGCLVPVAYEREE